MSTPAGQTRIVVTGVGVVGPLGCGVEEVWKRLLAGRSGIRRLPEVFAEGTGVAVGGQVPTLEDDAVAGALHRPQGPQEIGSLHRVRLGGGARGPGSGRLASD